MTEKTKNNKEIILGIISKAFENAKKAYDFTQKPDSSEHSRLIFPKKRDETIRVSEQELRFAFVEEFLKDEKAKDWFYAVEVPTKDKYRFSNKENPKVVEKGEIGQSASFDLALYTKDDKDFKTIALLEFKAGNPDRFCYTKDLVKLENDKEGDDEVLRFFIEIVGNTNSRTKPNIESKLEGACQQTNFICYELKNGKNTIELP